MDNITFAFLVLIHMGDDDVRNALARRLQRNLSDPAAAKISIPVQTIPVAKPPTTLPVSKLPPATVEPLDTAVVRVEGYLYKYSSGHLARWQKRFFVLENGRLTYYKKTPVDRDPSGSIAKKAFSIKRIKSVSSKDGSDDREFSLTFANRKSYQMRAPTNEDMRKWTLSLRGAMAFFETHSGEGATGAGSEDGGMSDDGADGMTSVNGSVISESSPRAPPSPSHHDHKLSHMLHGLVPRRESLSVALQLAVKPLTVITHAVLPGAGSGSPANHAPEPSMLEVEIDPDQLDKNYEEWFYFVPADEERRSPKNASSTVIHREIRMSHVVDACTRANNHLWATLASLPRGSDVKLEEAVGRAKARIKDPQAFERATIIVEEYLGRLSKFVCKCLDVRSSNMMSASHGMNGNHVNTAAELPQLMDCISRIITVIEKILPLADAPDPAEIPKCVCCYCDPSGLYVLKLERQNGGKKNLHLPSVACSTEKWRKSVRTILQRAGSELEVGLIEELHAVTQTADTAWESAARMSKPLGEDIHGPCPQTHPLFEDMKLAKPPVLMSSFGPSFIQAAQTKCLNASSQWMAAYPVAARLISEHTSSALVASLNSAWRHFKRSAMTVSEKAGDELIRKYTETLRNSREDSLRNSGASVSSVASAAVQNKPDLGNLEHLISFADECVLVSRFCAKTWSNGVSAKFTPEVFLTCMEGLSSGFLMTAADVCHSVVRLHYYPRVKYDMSKMFHSKNLSSNHATPMTHAKFMTEQFVSSVEAVSALPSVRDGVVAAMGSAAVKAYFVGVLKNRPRLKTFKTVLEMLKDDLQLWKDTFTGQYLLKPSALAPTSAVVEEIMKILNDKNRLNFSIHFNSVANLLGSSTEALLVISAVVKMREHEWSSSSEKKDLSNMVTSMKTIAAKEAKAENEDYNDTPLPDTKSATDDGTLKKAKNGAVIIALPVWKIKDIPWKFEE